ncbi:MAG: MarR family transcriptional regulator [Planctomycetota bacterium]|nr:MAG: MarR family transcriptional regulator [Planctomycetota bacterium]
MAPAPRVASTIARDCLAVRLRLVNRAVTAIYEQALRPWDLSAAQLNLLVAVASLDQASPTELGRLLIVDKSTLSRNLERMRARGWLAEHGAADARARPVRATAAGLRLLEEVLPAWQQAQRRVARIIGPDGVRSVHALARAFGPGLATPE